VIDPARASHHDGMKRARRKPWEGSPTLVLLVTLACSVDRLPGADPLPPALPGQCVIAGDAAADFTHQIGCQSDFDRLASEPLDISIPGARSTKFVIDTQDGDRLYFQNSVRYAVHWDFASQHLSGAGRPIVPGLASFNMTEYYSPDRRFILGAVTRYQGPKVWALELAPYDTASAAMIEKAFTLVARSTHFGGELFFHPTSQSVEQESARLPASVPIRTTDQLFGGIDFLPLNVGSALGRLRFARVADLANECLSFREIVVLDRVPNDLAVTMGIVTQEFQTPLSHINVLARARKIPNMWVRDAFDNPTLRALRDRWVRLSVRTDGFTAEEVTQAEADAWWEGKRPARLTLPPMDTSKTGLPDIETVVDPGKPQREELRRAIPAFGGKATHYAAMAAAGIVPMVKPSGFVIPVRYYQQFMEQNGFYGKVDALLADPTFRTDCRVQAARLEELRHQMEAAPVDPAFVEMLADKLAAGYQGRAVRYRSSSTAEDVAGFTGAGLYTSRTGDPDDPRKPPLEAIRKVWSSVWLQRGFQERDFRGVDQKSVGMAILAHPNFTHEIANGVAQTANSYDPTGLQPAFVINVQKDDGSVTLPLPGETTEQLIYYHFNPNQPIVYLSRSSQVPAGTTVLSRSQVHELGLALEAIQGFFRPSYGPPPDRPTAWYGLEVDFKFDFPPGLPGGLFVKQARPIPPPFDDGR
jgi:pyruvate,water dikinase